MLTVPKSNARDDRGPTVAAVDLSAYEFVTTLEDLSHFVFGDAHVELASLKSGQPPFDVKNTPFNPSPASVWTANLQSCIVGTTLTIVETFRILIWQATQLLIPKHTSESHNGDWTVHY